MPKSKKCLETSRSAMRRQASKEALKQMQMLLDDDDEEAYVPPNEDIEEVEDVTISESPPPKKKYKLSHRKSSDGNDRDVIVLKSVSNQTINNEPPLDLEVTIDELSDIQRELKRKYEEDEQKLQESLEDLQRGNALEVIYKGTFADAFELREILENVRNHTVSTISTDIIEEDSTPVLSYRYVMDPKLGIIVGTIQENQGQVTSVQPVKSKIKIASAVKAVTPVPQNTLPTSTPSTRTFRGRKTLNNSSSSTSANVVTSSKKITSTNSSIRNAKRINDKPKVVDLTLDDSPPHISDSREVSFTKVQGKTFPSLVIVARPHLRVSDISADRGKLDSKVKTVLMNSNSKFTEWLIQQGLIKAEQSCPSHPNNQLKLGMYSDVSKFPYSGGYVWISECCPQIFYSVFSGSFFDAPSQSPQVVLKLIYHWACQTNIQNVTQWVKVDNIYVRNVYTRLRAITTLAIQHRIRPLGGAGARVEVGIISLGTTSHDGSKRQVKVEVLGVLETHTKLLRLQAVEPMPEGENNYRRKFSKILEPIIKWVHPASTIVTDLTVDKTTLLQFGFQNVIQVTSGSHNGTNRIIMDYLRKIVPRMFQNTLSLLSRQIIQQFLDELVWREWFGSTTLLAFENIIAHIAEQTRINQGQSLLLKLNKVSMYPFRNWTSTNINAGVTSVRQSTPTPSTKSSVSEIKRYGRSRKSSSSQVNQERPIKSTSPDVPEQYVPLENYYYGTLNGSDKSTKITLTMKCPFCKNTFENNLQLQTHLFTHAHNVSKDAIMCRYCLTTVSTANELLAHINKCHPSETRFDNEFVCLICELHYQNPFLLGKHMSKEHCPHELPYQCGTCTFRCSNHKQIIDHFYMKHDGAAAIQCPFCLRSTTIWSGGRHITQNVQYFIQHLQKHQKKHLAKRCGKCNLWFVQKELLKDHQQKMHSSLRGRLGLIPAVSSRNALMVPKSKMDRNPCNAEIINFSSLYCNVPMDTVCKECGDAIVSSKHYPSFNTCQKPNCKYSTCCSSAMSTHTAKCMGTNAVIAPEALPFEMFCVCGYSNSDGNSMAHHLAMCEKKSAYPSKSEAKAATVMHSMLDILGLVRKQGEKNIKKSLGNKNEEKLGIHGTIDEVSLPAKNAEEVDDEKMSEHWQRNALNSIEEAEKGFEIESIETELEDVEYEDKSVDTREEKKNNEKVKSEAANASNKVSLLDEASTIQIDCVTEESNMETEQSL